MTVSRLFAITTLAIATAAFAQGSNPYNGTWRAEIESITEGKQGAKLDGKVVIEDQGGTFDMATLARKNPCAGRAYPITIRRATADELVFEINRSKALPGCKDGLARLKPTDANTLQGEFDAGRSIKLIRK